MHRLPRLSLEVLLALLVCPALFAGNGAGGGHAGGHSGGGGSSGHSFSHSVSHSLGHIFGHHSGERGSRLRKNAGGGDNSGRLVAAGFLGVGARRRMRLRNGLLDSGYCDSLRFSWRNLQFPGEFDCFGDAFLSDPFFYGASFGTYFWSDSFASSEETRMLTGPVDSASSELSESSKEPADAAPSLSNIEEPTALLQLLDGSTYGLTRYWVDGSNLRYVTNYGGENSVPLERIDFMGTQKLNASSGKRFDLLEDSHKP